MFFLVSEENLKSRRVINVWFTYLHGGHHTKLGWQNYTGEPSSYQSEFCVVHGQDTKSVS